MGNILKASSSLEHNRRSNNAVIYLSNEPTPARHIQKSAEKTGQLKQPKSTRFFQAKKSAAPVAPQSEVDRIVAGMKRNAS